MLQQTSPETKELINAWHDVVAETLPLLNPLDAAYIWKKGVAADDSDLIGITLVYRNPADISCVAQKTGLWVFIPFDDTMRVFPEDDHRNSLLISRSFGPARVDTHNFGIMDTWTFIASGEFE